MEHPGIFTHTQETFQSSFSTSLSTSITCLLRQTTALLPTLIMATSAKPSPSAAPLPGAALLLIVLAVAFLAGTCTAQPPPTIVPSVPLSNLTVKNDLARTINHTITQNFTLAGLPVAVYYESTLIRPNQSKNVPVGIPVGEVVGTLAVVIRVDNRSYSYTSRLDDTILSDLGNVTGYTRVTVSSPCSGDNPPLRAINVTTTTGTGLGYTTACLEPKST